MPIETLANRIKLAPELAELPQLQELYGQIDWSVRAIYTNSLGWFDARTHRLYPPDDVQAREVELMGGADAVLSTARGALSDGDPRWAAHLMGKLMDAGLRTEDDLKEDLITAYRAVGQAVENTNGRGWLLEKAKALEQGEPENPPPVLDEAFVDELPVSVFFEVMATRLIPETAKGVHESMVFEMTDTQERYVVTVRRGVAELVRGEALPGTPEPVAILTTNAPTWRRLALGMKDQTEAATDGSLTSTDLLATLGFMNRFDRGL